MRMWMCDPKILCRKHLLAEHAECHMFLGTLLKHKKIDGYINNDLLQPKSLYHRHSLLATEISNRGYSHRTPVKKSEIWEAIKYLPFNYIRHKINRQKSLEILISRCSSCKLKYNKLISRKEQ